MNRTVVMYVSMLAMVVAFVAWSMISPIAPQLEQVYHLSGFEKSVMVATPILLGSLLRIPMGVLVDRFGGRRVYTLLLIFVAVPVLGVSTAHSYGQLIAWEVLLGIAGASFAVGIGHVSAWYPPERQGLVLGITALGNLGTAVAGFTVPTLYLRFGFQTTGMFITAAVLAAAAGVWVFTRDARLAKGASPVSGASAAGARPSSIWFQRKLWLLATFYFITFGSFMAFGNYLPTLLQGQFHLTPVDSGLRAAGFVLLATALRPIGGYLADRIEPYRLLIGVFSVVAAASCLFAAGLDRILLTTVAALVIAAMVGLGNGIVFKLVPLYFPQTTGQATGLVGAVGGVGGFFPPLIMGVMKDATGSYSAGLLLLGCTCLVALGFAWAEHRRGLPLPPAESGTRVV